MRQHSRLTFRHLHRIQVSRRPSGEAVGYVGDLSKGGMRLIAEQSLEPGSCHELCLHVPDHRDQLYEINVVVSCQWVRKNSRREAFEMGFALHQPNAAFSDLIGQLLPRRR